MKILTNINTPPPSQISLPQLPVPYTSEWLSGRARTKHGLCSPPSRCFHSPSPLKNFFFFFFSRLFGFFFMGWGVPAVPIKDKNTYIEYLCFQQRIWSRINKMQVYTSTAMQAVVGICSTQSEARLTHP